MDFVFSKQTEHLACVTNTVPLLLIATTLVFALLKSLLELFALAMLLANILSHAELLELASLLSLLPPVQLAAQVLWSVWPPTTAEETLKPLLTACVPLFLLLRLAVTHPTILRALLGEESILLATANTMDPATAAEEMMVLLLSKNAEPNRMPCFNAKPPTTATYLLMEIRVRLPSARTKLDATFLV